MATGARAVQQDTREIKRAVTIRGSAATSAVSVLVLLIQASECAPLRCPPSDEMAISEPLRPPLSAADPEPRRAAETGPPRTDTPREVAPPSPAEQSRPPEDLPPQEGAPPREDASPPASTLPRPGTREESAALDLKSLERRLRETSAIGVFTKLSLKNQVDDLLEEFRTFHQGRAAATLVELRERFDLLVLKVLSLLQDSDVALARDIAASREALWSHLADPAKFRNL